MDGDNLTEWRLLPYKGQKTYYYASNVGRLLSWNISGQVHALSLSMNNRCPWDEKRGARYIRIYGDSPIHHQLVHRLVASVFCPCPSLFHNQVDHIDGNPFNNNMANLRWVTDSENKRARYALERGEIKITNLQKSMFYVN